MSLPIMTIERHIFEQQKLFPEASGTLTSLLYDIALSAKFISKETNRAGLTDILGASEETNTYGERQQKLDLFADDIIIRMNDHTGRLAAMASEEHDDIIDIPTRFDTGKYVLLYDPLDGSSNIDVNTSVGTIFSIHRKRSSGDKGCMEDMLQPGSALVAAGYTIYGSSTMLVYTTGQGVHGFTLDYNIGEFLLSHPNMRIPEPPKYYSVNQGNAKHWTEGVKRYTTWLQGMDADDPRDPLAMRYIGSMVADVHRNLLRGGVYYYPGDLEDPERPNGKLRLMFEAQALAFVNAQAGGYSSDGVGDILDIQPTSLHQRVPTFIGNTSLVKAAERFIAEYDVEWIESYRPFRDDEAVSA